LRRQRAFERAAKADLRQKGLDPSELITVRRGLDVLTVSRLSDEVYSLSILSGQKQLMG